jgi:hypothetical protein
MQALPHLVDFRTHQYISAALEQCHVTRVSIYYWILNISVVTVIALIVVAFVYYSWSKQLTPYEKRNKLIQDHEAVLKQIRVYKEEQQKIKSYTGLPLPETGKHRGEKETAMREVLLP